LSQSQDIRAVARASQADIRATNLINTRKRKELCLVWTVEEASDGLAALAVSVTANAAATPLVVVVARVGCMPSKLSCALAAPSPPLEADMVAEEARQDHCQCDPPAGAAVLVLKSLPRSATQAPAASAVRLD
jgi:hypothetical protein